MLPRSGLNSPAPKILFFYTNPCRKSCRGQGGKHVHPFIDGAHDGLPSHAGTAQAPEMEGDAGRPRGKPFFGKSRGRLLPPAKTPGAEQAPTLCHETWRISARRGYITAVPAEE